MKAAESAAFSFGGTMGLFGRLFGPKAPPRPPREILAEAIADVGDPSLVTPALELFDDPRSLIDQWEDEQGELPEWADPSRPKSAAELAFAVFECMLRENRRIGFLDWASGPGDIEEEFSVLFQRIGAAPVDDEERAHMVRATENCMRGQASQILWDYLHAMAEKRGLELVWISSDADCSYPIFMRPEVHQKWRRASFGHDEYVLP